MTASTTHTLEAPGAVLHYDVRPVQGSTAPILLMIGSPMDASGFTALAARFTDRTVVTYDPRGAGRSVLTEGAPRSTPDLHADDVARVITAIGGGPVDVFASSGGAVNALALVARRPELVRVLVAHEPPLAQALPDRDNVLAAIADIGETYQAKGWGAGMAKFIASTSVRGEFPADPADLPVPSPAEFGLPTDDDGSRDDVLLAQNLITCTHYQPHYEALRAASTRIFIGVGVESEGQIAYRAGTAVAERLGVEPAVFPSHHGGFMEGDFGMKGEPDAFAATLRSLLDS
ncbi:alpha/beta fold hydrolase [Nonomuraea maritima]|uniref:alpha/beta fold hydrolase n=1 Tax=Nonomuraea maritima TaxID=683260 RepID=UPI00371DB3E1